MISPVYASFTDSILIQAEGELRKVYYNGENITSVLFDPRSRSVIFETEGNAILEVKVPIIYEKGPDLFILKDGEEIDPEIKADDCFYYADIETKTPAQIEIIFAMWPEFPEPTKGCETIIVSPLKQTQYGIKPWDVKCHDGMTLLLKPSDSKPVCVTGDTAKKLIERDWRLPVSRGV